MTADQIQRSERERIRGKLNSGGRADLAWMVTERGLATDTATRVPVPTDRLPVRLREAHVLASWSVTS